MSEIEKSFDVAVVGLGAMGSAAIYQLSKLGANVVGIDQFEPPHKLGSTHGDTRITRQAIGEGEEYVPLVLRSNEIWKEIEQQTGRDLLTQNGGLIMASYSRGTSHHGSNEFLEETIKAARRYEIEHELLSNEEVRRRYPHFDLVGDEDGYFEPGAGFLRPEACVEAQLELAKRAGATVMLNTTVQEVADSNGLQELRTSSGTIAAKKVIVSAGPWVDNFLPEQLKDSFKIYRQVLYWFDIKQNYEQYLPENMPVYIWEFGGGHDDFLYGFPAIDGPGGGLKIASEQYESIADPNRVNRDVTAEETQKMFEYYVRPHFPDLSEKCVKAAACLYTVTPDHDFVIDTHPENENILIASPCSGHGFKHSAAIGEVLAQLALTGQSDIDISKFSFARLSSR